MDDLFFRSTYSAHTYSSIPDIVVVKMTKLLLLRPPLPYTSRRGSEITHTAGGPPAGDRYGRDGRPGQTRTHATCSSAHAHQSCAASLALARGSRRLFFPAEHQSANACFAPRHAAQVAMPSAPRVSALHPFLLCGEDLLRPVLQKGRVQGVAICHRSRFRMHAHQRVRVTRAPAHAPFACLAGAHIHRA